MDLPQSTPASHQGYHHTSLCRTAGQGLLLPDLHPLPTPLHPLSIPPHHLCSDSPHPGTETGGKGIAQGLDNAIPRSRFSVLLDVRQFWHKQPVPPSQLCFPARSREAAAFRDFTPDLSPWDRGSAATPCRGPGGRGPGATSAVTL